MWDIVLSHKLRYNVLVVAPPSAVERQELTNSTPTNQRLYHIRFVCTPKHTSWLNQVEIWFSILARRLLKRASFISIDI